MDPNGVQTVLLPNVNTTNSERDNLALFITGNDTFNPAAKKRLVLSNLLSF